MRSVGSKGSALHGVGGAHAAAVVIWQGEHSQALPAATATVETYSGVELRQTNVRRRMTEATARHHKGALLPVNDIMTIGTENVIVEHVLSDKQLALMDAYRRAANYLSGDCQESCA